MPISKSDKKYTYADYLTWSDDERWEVIDGIPYLMAAPSWEHQAISNDLPAQFNFYLRGKRCQVFTAPFDLCLPGPEESDKESTTVIQPDLLIICDASKLKGTGYFGVPELVVEIESSSSAKIDKIIKFNKYEKAGIPEYWIIEPVNKVISVFILQNKHYGRPQYYGIRDTDDNISENINDVIKVSIFPDLEIDLKRVFVRV